VGCGERTPLLQLRDDEKKNGKMVYCKKIRGNIRKEINGTSYVVRGLFGQ
jgi:hypothetical protein